MHRIQITLLLAVGLAVSSSCQTVQDILESAPRPEARVQEVRLQNLTLDSATLDFDVEVTNPYSVPLPVLDIVYGLAFEDDRFLTGTFTEGVTIPVGESRVLTLPATVRFADLLGAVSGVRPGAVIPYTADLEIALDAPGGQVVRVPLQEEGELPVPTVPSVELRHINWQSVTLNQASAVLSLGIGNTNEFPVELTELEYGLSLAGKRIISSSVDQNVSAEAGETIVLDIPISIRPSDLGLAAMDVLQGEEASYALEGMMKLDTPFGPLSAPFERSGRTPMER